jgi:hypothetical protein
MLIYKCFSERGFYGNRDRTAEVRKTQSGFYVDLLEGDDIVEQRTFYDTCEVVATQLAENWALGLICAKKPSQQLELPFEWA